MALGDQHDPPAIGEPGPNVAKDTRGVAPVGLGRLGIYPERLPWMCAACGACGRLRAVGGSGVSPGRRCGPSGRHRPERLPLAEVHSVRLVHPEGSHRPPREAEPVSGGADLRYGPERRCAKIDWRLPADGGVHPGRLEEFLTRPDKIGSTGTDAFRTAGVSRSSRHGGAQSPPSAASTLRWSATLK